MSDLTIKELLNYIQKQFLCSVPIRHIKWNNVFEHLDWEKQDILLKGTIFYERNVMYPIKISYQKAFVKCIIEGLEKQKTDIHDIVFDTYGRLVALPDIDPSFKHYLTNIGKLITLEENSSIISKGTTGLCTWQAGIALAEWCLANKHKIQRKTVLELGSGIGLSGVTVALFCHPAQIYLTDCNTTVLENLCSNIDINLQLTNKIVAESVIDKTFINSLLHRKICSKDATTVVDVLDLPWERVDSNVVMKANADVILAADIIYDSTIFAPLILALNYFLSRDGSQLILSCTERNEKTLRDFLAILEAKSFVYEEIPCPEQKNFVWSTECPIRFFEIALR